MILAGFGFGRKFTLLARVDNLRQKLKTGKNVEKRPIGLLQPPL